jgi:serine phosphatase RsbU (regulator of sigma subunit)
LDPNQQTVTYVNAGHGYSMLQDSQGELRKLDGGDGVPVGLDADINYVAQTVPLPQHARILIVSDGIIEQYGFSVTDGESTQAQQFGLEGVIGALNSIDTQADLVAELFATVERHAHRSQLADDATGVCISW